MTDIHDTPMINMSDYFKLVKGDAAQLLKKIPDNSVDLELTDPPYFIHQMGNKWSPKALNKSKRKAIVIGGLPVGMKFDKNQGIELQAFMTDIFVELLRVVKPGGFCISFSQARLYHRMAIAAEDAGFEIRDMMGWVYEGQPKAFTQDHFVRKMPISEEEKAEIITNIGGRKTPQLKPCIEPMILAQKPKCGTFVQNWMEYQVGLIDTRGSNGKFPGNIFPVPKPTREEKGPDNDHLTVKPIRLIKQLIRIFSKEEQTVLDPFSGSGSHGIAAIRTNRKYIGIELNPKYHKIAETRMMEEVRECQHHNQLMTY